MSQADDLQLNNYAIKSVTTKIFCNSCRRETKHEPIRDPFEDDKDEEVVSWQIVRCAGCDGISFYKVHFVVGTDARELVGQDVYPTRLQREPKCFIDAPARLDELYKETVHAFNISSLLFCAGGLRALVEGICADQNVKDGPKRDFNTGNLIYTKNGEPARSNKLDGKIEGLAERNILTQSAAQALHQHRYIGNAALHELDQPTKEMLSKAMDIIEYVMQYLYNIEAQASELAQTVKDHRNYG